MNTALVVGSANADLVYSVEDFPNPGQTIMSHGFQVFAGGKGANQAVASARAGTPVEFCGCLGDDANGSFLHKTLVQNNVGTSHTKSSNQPTGSAVILVNKSAENQIILNPGANHDLTPSDVQRAIATLNPKLILVQLEISMSAIAVVLEHKAKTILNPAPIQDLRSQNLEGLFAITPNETECQELTGEVPHDVESTRSAANVLIDRGIQNVIITLGRRGCYWTNGQKEHFQSPPSVTPIDTTGAGDVFNGALLAQLIEDIDFPSALAFAVTAASLSTTRHGALESAPRRAEIINTLKSL